METIPDTNNYWTMERLRLMDPESQLAINSFINSCIGVVRTIAYSILLPFGILLLIGNLTWYMYQKVQLNNQLRKKKHKLKCNIEEIRRRLGKVDIQIELTNLDLKVLKQKLSQNELKPIDVLRAYQFKALELYDSGNSGICEFILEAEQQALELAKLPSHTHLPLYGIPISVKELCPVAGYDCTYGLVKRCNDPKQEDCTIIKTLKAQGAIPFVLTTTTQLALGATGFNPIFGDSSHPFSETHEPGGSSAGEAVILSLHGSPIGFGTDAAGSIRVPASFCGLAGIKPTSRRISCQGMDCLHPNHICLLSSGIGPMGRKVEDLVEILRALFQPPMFDLDPTVPPLIFNETIYRGLGQPKLRIGYYDTLDGSDLMQTVPSIRRGVQEAVKLLKSMGHEVVKFTPPDPHKGFLIALRSGYASGTKYFHQALYAEPSNRYTRFLKLGLLIPHSLRFAIDQISGRLVGKPVKLMRTMSGPRNLDNCFKLLTKMEIYKNQFAQAWDKAGPLDALICPVASFPAFPKWASGVYLLPSVIYVILYNLIDYPAGTVRVGYVNRNDIDQTDKLLSSSNDKVSRYQKKVLEMQKSSLGLPIGIQVVAKPYREELVLRVMAELEQCIQNESSNGI